MQSKHPFSQTQSLWVFCALFVTLLFSGCKNYSVSVNDNLVYVPPSIFKDFVIADQRLFDCVQQTIYDAKITRAEDLTKLNCSNAGITSLAGLEKFFALKELNLADNKIVEISTLGAMGRLEILKLNNNNIKNPAPLLHLLHIKQLDLQGNATLDCNALTQITANLHNTKAELLPPAHCAG